LKKVINSALETESDIHFETIFLVKMIFILKRRENIINLFFIFKYISKKYN